MNRKSHQILQVNVIEYSTISNAIALMRDAIIYRGYIMSQMGY